MEREPLDELRAVVGNKTALAAYRAGTLPFPDGSVLVKGSKRYPATGGWGFGRFI